MPIKLAIYFRASLALLQMMLDQLKRFVNPNKVKTSKLKEK
jgi:hypothetical protein